MGLLDDRDTEPQRLHGRSRQLFPVDTHARSPVGIEDTE